MSGLCLHYAAAGQDYVLCGMPPGFFEYILLKACTPLSLAAFGIKQLTLELLH